MGSTALAIKEDNVPAHVAASMGAGRGNENVGAEVQIPRLKLLQKMHDEVDKNHAKFVKGAEVGLFYNTLTDQVYSDTLHIISITFSSEYTVWKNRDQAGFANQQYSKLLRQHRQWCLPAGLVRDRY